VLIVITVLGNIVTAIMNISKAISASTGFFDIIDSQPVCFDGKKEPSVSSYNDIKIDDVTFAYPTRSNVPVLKAFTARFEKGKTTALVGPSGSGKSTIVSLLERWYELDDIPCSKDWENKNCRSANQGTAAVVLKPSVTPKADAVNRGKILLGDHNINSLDLKWWRSQIGLVQQEPYLFNDSIFNNIAFGLLGSKWENEPEEVKAKLVEEACKEAFADEFIARLPQGYTTMVGENGIKLSGGQRQRLAIARSIIKRPSILILDEATSSIDVRAERVVQAALDNVSQSRTTIVIAHRLSTIRKADHIIVVQNGVKVEEGSHDDLISNAEGIYHNLVHAQQIDSVSSPREEIAEVHDHTEGTLEQPNDATLSDDNDSQNRSRVYKQKGFFGTVGLFLYEQRALWVFYLLTLLAAGGCGGKI
jgi:ATP-binding cassette subfamily B (MDR/TAP) protein 1